METSSNFFVRGATRFERVTEGCDSLAAGPEDTLLTIVHVSGFYNLT
jgi:hypothetical protein